MLGARFFSKDLSVAVRLVAEYGAVEEVRLDVKYVLVEKGHLRLDANPLGAVDIVVEVEGHVFARNGRGSI